MIQSGPDMAEEIGQAAIAFQRQLTGHEPKSASVALSSLWQKLRGRCLRLWAGFFVVETRSYLSQYCFVSTPRIRDQIRGASTRGTFATGC
jgi:hypothetical protein